MVIEPVVHLPEATLLRCGLGSARDELRARMRPLVRKVSEDIDEALSKRLAQPHEHLAKTPTIGAKKVAIQNDAHHAVRAIAAATYVIPAGVDSMQKSIR
jgi:hypothetical protein